MAPTLPQLSRAYLTHRKALGELRPTSVSTIRYTLDGFHRVVGEVTPARLRREHIEAWLIEKQMAPATARSQLSQLRAFFGWCVRNGYVTRDPTVGVRGPKPPRYLPRSLRLSAVEQTLDHLPDARAQAIVLLMAQEGLRCCEVANLQVADVDPAERVMLIHGKGGHQRVLPISDETWEALRSYLVEHPSRAGPFIRSYNHPRRGLTASWISRMVSGWIHGAGVEASGHALRHTALTDMLRAGANVRDVQAAAGHASLATTGRYLGWSMGDLRQAMGGRRYGRGEQSISTQASA